MPESLPNDLPSLYDARAVAEKKIEYWIRYLHDVNQKIDDVRINKEQDLLNRLKDSEKKCKSAEANAARMKTDVEYMDPPQDDFEL